MHDATPHESFELLRERSLPSLRVHVAEYRHRRTGAEHLHIARDSEENVFLVALRTVPRDSSGVAHILEHTALCGSRRFPVHDPFFMMLRRSLSTFMNALTASDWTAYPFSTLNRKDFDNLLQVYLDAVFFPQLHPLDFAQEGHRLEFAERDDPDSPLQCKGVVYNEMKGAMSAPGEQLYQHVTEHLFPTATYHHNSGGDPASIPSLRHEQLLAFHRRHYHPSNAIFATCGDMPAREQQQRFESLALDAFPQAADVAVIADERRYAQPQRVAVRYPAPDGGMSAKTHIVLSWLLGKSADLQSQLHAQLLSQLLLDNSASPLRHALETTALGSAMSPMSGLEDGCREMFFACGIEGSEPERADALEDLALGVIERVAQDGVPDEDIQASLHQIELEQREIGGDHYPYGLQLIMNCLGAAVHRGDPIAHLDKDSALAQLRADTEDAGFVPGLARRLLLENPHRLRLSMAPDARMAERQRADETQRLAQLQKTLDPQRQQEIVELAKALHERQQAEDDPDLLPRLTLEDIPGQRPDPSARRDADGQTPTHRYAQGTNGLVYQHMVFELPALDDEEIALLPLYTRVLTELGCAGQDYLQTQKRQALHCGHLGCGYALVDAIDDIQRVSARLVVQGNALARNVDALDALLYDSVRGARFDELDRLRELVAQMRARADHGVTNRGHRLAVMAAERQMSPAAHWRHRSGGLPGIRALRALDDRLDEPARRAELAAALSALHLKITDAPPRALLIGEDETLAPWDGALRARWRRDEPAADRQPFGLEPVRAVGRQVWQTETAVNFCARSWPTVPATHADAPALSVLGQFLRNGYLHPAIREQGGAYGSGAVQHNAAAAFTCFSYRDPRLLETLAVFDSAPAWVLDQPHADHQVDEAILGAIGALDKPASPAGEASQHFYNELDGRDAPARLRWRNGVLNTRLADLRRVAERYLTAVDGASGAVLTGKDSAPDGACRDWERETL